MDYTTIVPFKKRKITIEPTYESDIKLPLCEMVNRKKCAILEEGLAIKYNKLMFNLDEIINFDHFYKYYVYFDVFSKRHLIYHNFRIDLLEKLNRFDFTPFSYKECLCQNKANLSTRRGYILCFGVNFMKRKKYVNNNGKQSIYMKNLYIKHSKLSVSNNFYDSRINECFINKIRDFEKLYSINEIDRKNKKKIYKNMLSIIPDIPYCIKCKYLISTDFDEWSAVHYNNTIDFDVLPDLVLKLDNKCYLVPNQDTLIDANTYLLVYKTTKANIVFMYNDIFYVVNPEHVFLIFTVEIFRKIQFFCNFNFYFVQKLCTYNSENYIIINRC